MSTLRERWRQLFSSTEDLEAQELREESAEYGADAIADVVSGQVTTLTGVVRSLVLRPQTRVPMLEAVMYDGSGMVTLKWMGRRRIRGINPGAPIAVTGRLVRCDGELTMFNPNYTLFPKAGES